MNEVMVDSASTDISRGHSPTNSDTDAAVATATDAAPLEATISSAENALDAALRASAKSTGEKKNRVSFHHLHKDEDDQQGGVNGDGGTNNLSRKARESNSTRNDKNNLIEHDLNDAFDLHLDGPYEDSDDEEAAAALASAGQLTNEEQEEEQEDAAPSESTLQRMRRVRLRLRVQLQENVFYYDCVLGAITILSSFEYILASYWRHFNERGHYSTFGALELVCSVIFAVDWLFNFFLTDLKLTYIFSKTSLIDLLTCFPIWITYGRELPTGKLRTGTDMFMWVLFGLLTTRLLSMIRIKKLISAYYKNNVDYKLAMISLYIMMMVLYFAAVLQFLEVGEQNMGYHNWMYWVIVTISTVGYGDISPVSDAGRVFVMCVILLAMVLIPQMVNDLLNVMALESVYARLRFEPKGGLHKHIVLCGHLESTNLESFFRELFHEVHSTDTLHAVVLLPVEPFEDFRQLLQDNNSLRYRTTYLMGSALVKEDLLRASVQTAEAVFIMTDKFTSMEDHEDTKTILIHFSLRHFLSTYQGTDRVPTTQTNFLQLMKPESVIHVQEAFPFENFQNVVICMNEIKMGILAKAMIHPASNTLLMNLLQSQSAEEAARNVERLGNSQDPMTKKMFTEYQDGCAWEIYTTPLSKMFIGFTFVDLAFYLYETSGIVPFALKVSDVSNRVTKIVLNPPSYVIPSFGHFKIEVFVLAKDLSAAVKAVTTPQISMHLLRQEMARVGKLLNQGNGDVNPVLNNTGGSLGSTGSMRSMIGTASSRGVHTSKSRNELMKWMENNRDMLLSTRNHQEIIFKKEQSYFKTYYYCRKTPAVLSEVTIRSSLEEEFPHVKNHLLIVTNRIQSIFDLVRPLRAKFLGNLRYIVIMYPHQIPAEEWQRIAIFDSILVFKGSALQESNLRRAGIFRAVKLVVLPRGLSHSRQDGGSLTRHATLVDAETIFVYHSVKKLNPEVQVVLEMVDHNNVAYLDANDQESAGFIENGHLDFRFSRKYAGGLIFVNSLLDSYTCQSFHTSDLLQVLNKLLCGYDFIPRSHFEKEARAALENLNAVTPSRYIRSWGSMHDRSIRAVQASSVGFGVGWGSPGYGNNIEKGGEEREGFGGQQKQQQQGGSCSADSGSGNNGNKSTMTMRRASWAEISNIVDPTLTMGEVERTIDSLESGHLYQMRISSEFISKTYGELFAALAREGQIPLGLFRVPSSGRRAYVFTNPRKDVLINKRDRVFVLSCTALRAMMGSAKSEDLLYTKNLNYSECLDNIQADNLASKQSQQQSPLQHQQNRATMQGGGDKGLPTTATITSTTSTTSNSSGSGGGGGGVAASPLTLCSMPSSANAAATARAASAAGGGGGAQVVSLNTATAASTAATVTSRGMLSPLQPPPPLMEQQQQQQQQQSADSSASADFGYASSIPSPATVTTQGSHGSTTPLGLSISVDDDDDDDDNDNALLLQQNTICNISTTNTNTNTNMHVASVASVASAGHEGRRRMQFPNGTIPKFAPSSGIIVNGGTSPTNTNTNTNTTPGIGIGIDLDLGLHSSDSFDSNDSSTCREPSFRIAENSSSSSNNSSLGIYHQEQKEKEKVKEQTVLPKEQQQQQQQQSAAAEASSFSSSSSPPHRYFPISAAAGSSSSSSSRPQQDMIAADTILAVTGQDETTSVVTSAVATAATLDDVVSERLVVMENKVEEVLSQNRQLIDLLLATQQQQQEAK